MGTTPSAAADDVNRRTIGGRRAQIPARTLRRDNWLRYPLTVWAGLGLFTAYGLYVAFANQDYFTKPYLSPFYSPCIATNCHEDLYLHFVPVPANFSPALIILIFPGLFRASCYYYRKATYRAFLFSPPACAVSEPARRYSGEMSFPWTGMNLHRYAWYAAALFSAILCYDAAEAFFFPTGTGIGVGTGVLIINAVLIAGYTFGCHSCRHIVGGRINSFSRHPLRYRFWTLVSRLNAHHEAWAWASMLWIMGTDLYIRLVANGVFADPHWIWS